MISAGSAIAFLDLDTSRFRAGLQGARRDFSVFLDQTRTMEQRAGSLSRAMGTLGSSMTRTFTLPLVGIGTAATKLFSDFEQGIKKIKTLDVDGVLNVDRLEEDMLDISSKYGVAVTEINEATYQLASALGEVSDHMADHVDTAVQLSIGGFTDTVTAIDGMTTAMNIYGNQSVEFGKHVSDVLLTTQRLGKTTAGEIASSWGDMLPIAKQLGISVEEIGASYVQLTKNGLATSKATTGLKAAFTNIIKPSSEAKEAAAALGLEFHAAAFQQKGFAGFMQEVRDKIGNAVPAYGQLIDRYGATAAAMRQLEEEGKKGSAAYQQQKEKLKELEKQIEQLGESANSPIAMFGQLFGSVEALNAMMILLADGGIEEYNKAVEEMKNSTGATEEAVKEMLSTVQTDWKKTINQAKNLLIEFGKELAPYVSKGLVKIYQFLEAIRGLSPETKKLIVQAGLFAAAAGPVMMIGSKIIGGFLGIRRAVLGVTGAIRGIVPFFRNAGAAISFMRGGMGPLTGQAAGLAKVFTFLISPLGLVTVALVALAGLFIGMLAKSEKLRTEMGRLGKNILRLGSWIVKGLYEKAKPVFDWIGNALKWLGDKLAKLVGKLNDEIESIPDIALKIDEEKTKKELEKTGEEIEEETSKWDEIFEKAGLDAGQAGAEGLEQALPEFNEAGYDLGESASDGIREGLEKSKEHYEKLAEDLQRQLDKNKDALNRFGDAIVEALKRKYDEDKKHFDQHMEAQTEKAKKEFEKIKDEAEKAHRAAMDVLDAEYDPAFADIERQIADINGRQDAEDKAEDARQHQNRVYEIEFRIRNAKDDKERIQAERDLAELQHSWNRKQLREQRRAQVEQLRQQKEALKQQLEERRKAAEEEHRLDMEAKEKHHQEVTLKNLEKERETYEEHYKKKTESYALSEEARQLVVEGKNQEILELLQTFYPEWQNVGQSFSEKLTEGLNSGKKTMQQAISEMLNLKKVIPQQEQLLRSYRNRLSEIDAQMKALTNTAKTLSRALVMPKIQPTPVQVPIPQAVYVPSPYNPYVSDQMAHQRKQYEEAFKNASVTKVPKPIAGGGSGGGVRDTWKKKNPRMHSHADGLRNVPYDGYTAMLHRNEAVLTAKDNDRLKSLEKLLESTRYTGKAAGESNNFSVSVRIDNLSVGTSEKDRRMVAEEITRQIQRSRRGLGVK
ncbi:MAG: phage tail tape measure protein [Peptostreptococcaceae bacterium]|nr:phage tail tape measure protein [Peptostreptococcaceae bacterium]